MNTPFIPTTPAEDDRSSSSVTLLTGSALLQTFLNGVLIASTMLVFASLYFGIQQSSPPLLLITLVYYAGILLTTFFVRLPDLVRTYAVLVLLLLLGFTQLFTLGEFGFLALFTAVILASILLPGNRWALILVANGVLVLLAGWALSTGSLLSILPRISAARWIAFNFITAGLGELALAGFSALSIARHLGFYQQQMENDATRINEYREERDSLQENSTKTEATLRRRSSQFETASRMARDISQFTDLDELLQRTVEMIPVQLGHYHAGIFLADRNNEYAVLKAATGEAGRAMLNASHRLRIGEEGIVGNVVYRGEARIALDVGEDAVHFKNPHLPYTRSEMALPIRIRNRTIGALDVQSKEAEAFSSEDIAVLQTIADQLGATVENANLIASYQQKIDELENGLRLLTRQTWADQAKRSRSSLSFTYRNDQLLEQEQIDPETWALVENGEPVVRAGDSISGDGSETILAVPIKLRDQILGVVNLRLAAPHVTDEMRALVESASNRLAVALETARLLEQLQEQAEQEHMVGNISSKVRSSTSIDDILRTAVEEIGRSMGISEVRVQLKPTTDGQ